VQNRPDLIDNIASLQTRMDGSSMLAIVSPEKLRRILNKMLDENEFLSPYGIRSLSRYHADHPYIFRVEGQEFRVDYEPAESTTGLFGGNSNWRGPVWFPMNALIIESLRRFYHCLGDDFRVECPTGSGVWMTLDEVEIELSHRLIRTFLKDSCNRRPVFGNLEIFQTDPYWYDLILFHEYFHGDNGVGLGANYQTGWTGEVAVLIQQVGRKQGL
ncbi:MAG: glucosidase, partial [Kovacikia sp.]